MHAAQDVFMRGAVEAFAKVCFQAVRLEDGSLNCFDEVTAIIVGNGELQDEAAGQL